MSGNTASQFYWADAAEANLCLCLNRAVRFAWLKLYLRLMSRLGNGALWYITLLALPLLGGSAALSMTLHIGLTAAIGVVFYKVCKRLLVRDRPFVTHQGIACIGTPLDSGSFPSGHTIHAVCFAVMLAGYEPSTAAVYVPIAISIALSRIVLGHHYPSDVIAGGIIGLALGLGSLGLAHL